MEAIYEIKELLETHRRESNEWRNEVSRTLAKIEVHNEYTQKKLETVDKLEAESTRQKGFLKAITYIVSILGLTGVEEWLRHLSK